MRKQRAFTFVEAVAVIVLIGILSAFAMSRFGNEQAFAVENLSRSVIADARLAQQTAIARRGDGVQLQLTRTASGYRCDVTAQAGAQLLLRDDIEARDALVQLSAAAVSRSLNVNDTASYQLDALGSITNLTIAGTGAAVNGGLSIAVSGAGSRQLCVARSGFAHRGACL